MSPYYIKKMHDGWGGGFHFKKRQLINVEEMTELQLQMK